MFVLVYRSDHGYILRPNFRQLHESDSEYTIAA